MSSSFGRWSARWHRIRVPYFRALWLRRGSRGGGADSFSSLSVFFYRGRPVIIRAASL